MLRRGGRALSLFLSLSLSLSMPLGMSLVAHLVAYGGALGRCESVEAARPGSPAEREGTYISICISVFLYSRWVAGYINAYTRLFI